MWRVALRQGGAQDAGPLLFARAGVNQMLIKLQARPGTDSAISCLGPEEARLPPGNSGRETVPPAKKRGRHHPKPDIPVPVVRVIVVAIGTPHVVVGVVERAATQHPASVSLPPQRQSSSNWPLPRD